MAEGPDSDKSYLVCFQGKVLEAMFCFLALFNSRGALHSLEKAYEIFSEQKDLYGFLMDFSGKQKDFCQRCTRFFGVKCPSSIVTHR